MNGPAPAPVSTSAPEGSPAITVWAERDLEGAFAAILVVVEDAVAVMFDPRATRAVPLGILRAWAQRQVAAGWLIAILRPADVSKLTD